jgi:hypothetical protein
VPVSAATELENPNKINKIIKEAHNFSKLLKSIV